MRHIQTRPVGSTGGLRARPANKAAERHRTRWTFFAATAIVLITLALFGAPEAAAQVEPASGSVWAWGSNTLGTVGDGTAQDRLVATETLALDGGPFLRDVVAVDSNDFHNLALLADGTIAAWGSNTNGKIGDGTTTTRYSPVSVLAPDGVTVLGNIVDVAAGRMHSLAVAANGTVWAWGLNDDGQLGDGTTTDRSLPALVHGPGGTGFLTDIIAVAAGRDHSLALAQNGTVWAWGQGPLGDGTTGDGLTPVHVLGEGGVGLLEGVVQLSGAQGRSFAVKSDGTLWGWGGNFEGRLGDGTTTTRLTPVQVVGEGGVGFLEDVVEVSSTLAHALALRSDGTVWAWGTNAFGALGDGTLTNAMTPVQVHGEGDVGMLGSISSVHAANFHSFAIGDDGTAWSWGDGSVGRLGSGDENDRTTPGRVVGPGGEGIIGDLIQVSGGRAHGVAIRAEVPPSAPNGLAATAGPGSGEITVTWGAPLDSGGAPLKFYVVHRDGVPILNTTFTTFIDTGLGHGATHAYEVSAVNDAGESQKAGPVSATTFDTPSAPEDFVVEQRLTAGRLGLDWTAPADDGGTPITKYRVYRSSGPSGFFNLIAEPTATHYDDDGLPRHSTWYYFVTAVNAAGEGPRTPVLNNTTLYPPTEVQNAIAFPGTDAGSIELDWDVPADDGGKAITHYNIHRSLSETGPYEIYVQTSFTEVGLINLDDNTTYHWEIEPMNGVCCTDNRVRVNATTYALPSAPLGLAAAATSSPGEIALSWSAPSYDGGDPIDAYAVYRDGVFVANTTATTYTDTGLVDGTTYTYNVTAWNVVGESVPSADATATSLSPPGAPQDLVATTGQGSGEIDLSWSPPLDDGGSAVTRYAIYRDGSFTANVSASSTSFFDTDLAHGTTYEYRVTAWNAAGEGAESRPASATTLALPDIPANVSARSGPEAGEVTLRFETPVEQGGSNVSSFNVYRGLTQDDLALVASPALEDLASAPAASMTAYTYTDDGLTNGTTYWFAVSAVNDQGEGTVSSPVFASTYTSDEPPEPLPTGRTLTSAVFDGRYGYVFGGLAGNVSDGSSIDDIVRFDPVNETNEVFDRLPSPRHATSSVWVPGNQSAYIFFGHENNSTGASASTCHPVCYVGTQILKYSPVPVGAQASASSGGTFKFIEVDDNVSARHSTASVYVPPEFDSTGQMNGTGLAYVFGGLHEDPGPSGSTCHPVCYVGTQIGILDPLLDKFDIHATTLPEGVYGASGVYVPHEPGEDWSGKVYLFGGHETDGGASGSTCHPVCYVGTQILSYDPVEGKVDVLSVTLPSERWYTSAAFDGTYAYIFGGENASGQLDEIVRFDPATGDVTVIGSLPSERGGTSAVSTTTGIYVFGGDDGDETLDDVVRFRPTAPQDAQAKGGGGEGEITVSWQPPANADFVELTGYHVYGGTTSGDLSLLAVLPDTQTTFVHAGLDDGETRFYKVSAISATDEGPQSDEVTATTFTRASAPQGFQAQQDLLGTVHLSWDPPQDNGGTPIMEYNLYRRDGPAPSSFQTIATLTPDQTSFDDHGCTIGEVCDYYVVAFNLLGGGDLSDQVTVIGTKVV